MAVYTALTHEEIHGALAPFGLGQPIRIEPVAAGVENTTYFVTFRQERDHCREYVLTLGESIAAEDMAFVAGLTTTLQQQGLPVPAPLVTREGASIVYLAQKPALLTPKAAGRPPQEPSAGQCHRAGMVLAEVHRATLTLEMTHTSHKSLAWVAKMGRTLLPHLQRDTRQLLCTNLAKLDTFVSANENLPKAIIHGDLFRDNTLFVDEQLTAIIDFFSAGSGYLLFDVAVAANDWCVGTDCRFVPDKLEALLSGYDRVRRLTLQERNCWGEMLAIAALRFWVSRLAERILPSSSRPAHPTKDPEPYQHLLARHCSQPQSWEFGSK